MFVISIIKNILNFTVDIYNKAVYCSNCDLGNLKTKRNKMKHELETRIVNAYLNKEISLLGKELAMVSVDEILRMIPEDMSIDDVYADVIGAVKPIIKFDQDGLYERYTFGTCKK